MKLRPRQETFVSACIDKLKDKRNTIAIAPTGAGKTVMMAGVASGLSVKNGIVLQHSDELVEQNRKTFWRFNSKIRTDLFTADRKRWVGDGWTFAMVQTLSRANNLDTMPPVDALFIDEAHHVAADSYQRVIHKARSNNPDLMLFGVTATPNRGDKKALLGLFDNCADQITIQELIASGFLVKPRTYVIDIGTQDELRGVKKLASDFDMAAVESIMDKDVHNERIVEEWQKIAGTRRTVVFCSTVAHAKHVVAAFRARSIETDLVVGEMGDVEREKTLKAFDQGKIQVLVNVAVLTEGWDCQPVGCVVLLRPSSYKSTMVQMIGRGLRKVDPERYPGIIKDDCIVLDFGTSVLTHGAIEDSPNLEGKGTKSCPECKSVVPAQASDCPICGHEFPSQPVPTKQCSSCGHQNGLSAKTCAACGEPFPIEEKERGIIENFVLTEVDLLQQSPFRWENLFNGIVMVACAFDVWSMIVQYYGRWYSLGCTPTKGVVLLGVTEDRIMALATADDFMREEGDSDTARKTKRWLSEMPTDKQLLALGITDKMAAIGMTRYQAACRITWKWNEKIVRAKLERAVRAVPQVAAA